LQKNKTILQALLYILILWQMYFILLVLGVFSKDLAQDIKTCKLFSLVLVHVFMFLRVSCSTNWATPAYKKQEFG